MSIPRVKIPMRTVTFKMPSNEIELVERYCVQENRTKTDVMRELVRTLRDKVKEDEYNE